MNRDMEYGDRRGESDVPILRARLAAVEAELAKTRLTLTAAEQIWDRWEERCDKAVALLREARCRIAAEFGIERDDLCELEVDVLVARIDHVLAGIGPP